MSKVIFKLASVISVFSIVLSLTGCTQRGAANEPIIDSFPAEESEPSDKALIEASELGSIYEYNRSLSDAFLTLMFLMIFTTLVIFCTEYFLRT